MSAYEKEKDPLNYFQAAYAKQFFIFFNARVVSL